MSNSTTVIHSLSRNCALSLFKPLLGFVILCLALATHAQAESEALVVQQQFLKWASENLHPIASVSAAASTSELEPLRNMIGEAEVVSFGEGLHGGAEPLDIRNYMFRYLVEQLGFSAIAIESGFSEGLAVNEYALGGPGELDEIVAQGFGYGFGTFPQSSALIKWIRTYNEAVEDGGEIEFYGFDAPPGDPKMAIEYAMGYLDKVDQKAADELRVRVGTLLPMLNLNRFGQAPNQYAELSQEQRDRLTAAIADMNTLFKINQGTYKLLSSPQAYELAYQSAVVAAQVDEYLRQVPVGWTPQAGIAAISGTIVVSDRSKADNSHWVKEQQGSGGKVLLFAHRDHTATAPVTVTIPEGNPFGLPPAVMSMPPMMGMFLQPRYQANLVSIVNLLAEDVSRCGMERELAPEGSLEALLASLGPEYFLLDLRTAPPEVALWLSEFRQLYGLDMPDSISVGKAFDIIFFSRRVSPAVPCP